jgi:hypothetical protein
MADVSKTAGVDVLTWQDVATGNVVISSPIDVDGKLSATFFGNVARRSGTAFTSGWPNVRVEASAKNSGDDAWFPLFQYQTSVGTAISNTTLSATVVTGSQSFTVATSANIQAGDLLYLGDTSASNWEIVRVKALSGNIIVPEQAVQKDHASGASVTDQAEKIACILDLLSVTRLRAVLDNAGGGQTAAVELFVVTGDSIA